MWRLSGIERDVYLYSTPKQYISDYKVISSLDKKEYKEGIFGQREVAENRPDSNRNPSVNVRAFFDTST